jgi:hypothetical protein
MRGLSCLLTLCAGLACAQQAIPSIDGETLSGRKVSLPAALGGSPALLIVGFTHASQAQTKAWSTRVSGRFPAWSIAVLEDVPRLVRGMATHGIKSGTPKDQYDHFLLIYHGEKKLKEAAGFDRPDDAYLLVVDGAGAVRWSYHGPVTDVAVEQIASQLNHGMPGK